MFDGLYGYEVAYFLVQRAYQDSFRHETFLADE